MSNLHKLQLVNKFVYFRSITLRYLLSWCAMTLLLYVIRNELEQSDYKLIMVAGLDGRKTLCLLTSATVSCQIKQ